MTNEHAGIDSSGAIQRKLSYLVKYPNLQGNLQATLVSSSKGRNDIVEKYNLAEFETYYTIYHKYNPEDYVIGTENRIYIRKDPRKQLTESMISSQDTRIRSFQVIGCREPVAKRSSLEFYEMYLKEIFRVSL